MEGIFKTFGKPKILLVIERQRDQKRLRRHGAHLKPFYLKSIAEQSHGLQHHTEGQSEMVIPNMFRGSENTSKKEKNETKTKMSKTPIVEEGSLEILNPKQNPTIDQPLRSQKSETCLSG